MLIHLHQRLLFMLEERVAQFYRARLTAALSAAPVRGERSAAPDASSLLPVPDDNDLLKAAFRSALGFCTCADAKYTALPTGVVDINRLAMLMQHGQTKYDEALGRITSVLADVEGFTLMPRPFQLRIVDLWLELSAPVWFGNSWQARGEEIRTRFAWRNEHIGIGAVQSGRKDGKSTGGAFTAALGLLNVPNYSIHVFSTKLEQSMIILNMTYRLLLGHERVGDFRVKASETKLSVEFSKTDVRTMEAMSSNITVMLMIGFFIFFYFSFFLVCQPPYLFFLFFFFLFFRALFFLFYSSCRQQIFLLGIRYALCRSLHIFACRNRRASRVGRLLHALAHEPDDALIRIKDARLHNTSSLYAGPVDRHTDLFEQSTALCARRRNTLLFFTFAAHAAVADKDS